MKQMKINHQSQAIELSKSFASKASKYGSEEYRILTAAQKDFPSYKTIITASAKRKTKDSYKGLSYEYMERYINAYEPEETRAEVLAKLKEMKFISQCHSVAHRYPVIKKWFLDKYPNVKNCGLPDTEIDTADEIAPEVYTELAKLSKTSGKVTRFQDPALEEQAV